MAATVNLAALTFSADQLRQMNELMVEAVLTSPELSLFHSFQTGIRNDRQIGISPGTLGLIGKAAQGCGDRTPESNTLVIALKTWSPKRIEVILRQCYTDLETSLAKLARNLGVEIYDLTSTEYFAFVLEILRKDITKMVFRHLWFGDTAAANVSDSPAGVITDGISTDYFNLINGFFQQLAVIYAADANRKTSIAANAQATTALQFSAFSATNALDALNAVVDDAPAELTAQSDRFLLVTDSVHKKARRALQALGVAYKTELQTGGIVISEWDGIPLYSIPLWDQWIRAYQSNGTKLNNPHRIVYTTKSNLMAGMEGNGMFESLDVHYDKVTKYNYIETVDAFDAKVIMDGLVQVGI